MIKPWKKIKEIKLQVGFRKLLKKTFLLPGGKQTEFVINNEGRTVCILALTSDQRVILAKQFRAGPEKVLLELPGGHVESRESPRQAAQRELKEETGYKGQLKYIGPSLHSAYSTLIRHNFIALNCEKIANPQNESDEITEVQLMSLEEFKKHLRSGLLSDMGTGYRALDYLNLLFAHRPRR